MKIFLSWAGDASKAVALALRELLPNMLQGLKPFVSAHDIDSGTRWAGVLAAELEQTNYGILCLTPSALKSDWLLFEAGALTKLKEGRACGLLHGLALQDVAGPLAQFQHRPLDPEHFLALLRDLNKAMPEPLDSSNIAKIHSKWWPDLAEMLGKIPSETGLNSSNPRGLNEVLEELVTRVRNVERLAERERARTAISKRGIYIQRRNETMNSLDLEEADLLKRCLSVDDGEPVHEVLRDAEMRPVSSLMDKGLVFAENKRFRLAHWLRGWVRNSGAEGVSVTIG